MAVVFGLPSGQWAIWAEQDLEHPSTDWYGFSLGSPSIIYNPCFSGHLATTHVMLERCPTKHGQEPEHLRQR